jgi:hypothetical protein
VTYAGGVVADLVENVFHERGRK